MKKASACIKWITAAVALIHGCALAQQPVWHCSRTNIKVADASESFTLAGLGLDREYIQISIRDLYNAYHGMAVHLGEQRLSACIGGDAQSTKAAMESLGIPTNSLLFLAQRTLLSAKIYSVRDEKDMESCIAKHHPAIGYLKQATVTEAIGPCF